MLDRSIVVEAYRKLLGRDPESEAVIAHHAERAGEAELIAAIKSGEEYTRRQKTPSTAATGGPIALDGTSPFAHLSAVFNPVSLIRRHLAENPEPTPGRLTNAFGVVIDPVYLPDVLAGREGEVEPEPIPANWHADVAEFAAVFRALELSGETFAMAELGCGWGCWMSISGVAARRSGRAVRLVGVEADAGHLDFARRCLAENGFGEMEVRFHRGVAAAQGGVALFPTQSEAGRSWGLEPIFGASQEERERAVGSGAAEAVPMVSMAEVIGDLGRLDLLHVDIQGGEAALVADSLDLLSERVRYLVIGTHSRQIEGELIRRLSEAGWLLEVDRPGLLSLTPDGPKILVDGVQGWRGSASRDS